jgi:hypothetical protein
MVCNYSCSFSYVGQVAHTKQRCYYSYIGIAVSHFADRMLEAVPTRAMTSFLRFLDHTQRSTTVGRTPLDERSARSRDLYLKTHNTHNRQTSMPPAGFEPAILAGLRLRLIFHERHCRSPQPSVSTQQRGTEPQLLAARKRWSARLAALALRP